MKRVALLPTGRMEWKGLPPALDRLFPGNRFYALPTEHEIKSHPEGFPAPGFTSNLLRDAHEMNPPEATLELVARAAQAAIGDRRASAADIVIIIDDIELRNAHQPERVLRVFRRAVELHLLNLQGARASTERALLERVSFHLVLPMIESWLFGDSGALASAGLPAGASPLVSSQNLEEFLTEDAVYVAATESDCPCWVARGRNRKRRPKWLGDDPRERHPKGYLQWLCRDGAHKDCTSYDEVEAGGRALEGIAWEPLLAREGMHYLRALLADVEEAIGHPPTVGTIEEPAPPATSLRRQPREPVLRNL